MQRARGQTGQLPKLSVSRWRTTMACFTAGMLNVIQRARRSFALVGLDHIRPGDPPVALGLASVAAALQRHGVPHKIITANVANGAPDTHAVAQRVFDSGCSDVAIGAFVWNEPYVQDLTTALRTSGKGRGPAQGLEPARGLE